MKISGESSLVEVAIAVASALERAGIGAVLTGGACASFYSRGAYTSSDLDFILQTAVRPAELDTAMGTIGFRRQGNHYEHPESPFFVEFPAGPLGIGSDLHVQPVEYRVGAGKIMALSATDSCRDRLAAFFHWGDRQSLETAVAIARQNKVDLDAIRKWSATEDSLSAYSEFLEALGKSQGGSRRTRG